MKTLLTGIATFLALGTALPAFASDITSDRYAASGSAQPRPVTRIVAASSDRRASEPKRAQCACERASREERPAAARQEPGGH